MRQALWELVFMLVILKIPVVYLCLVVIWAVRAEPRPLEGAALAVPMAGGPQQPPRRGPRRKRDGPHGGPARTYSRRARAARARVDR